MYIYNTQCNVAHSRKLHSDGGGARPRFETRSCHRFQADLKHKILFSQPDTGITGCSHDDAWLPYFWKDWLLLSLDTELTYHGEPHSGSGYDTSPLGQTRQERVFGGWGQGTGPLAVPQIFPLKCHILS